MSSLRSPPRASGRATPIVLAVVAGLALLGWGLHWMMAEPDGVPAGVDSGATAGPSGADSASPGRPSAGRAEPGDAPRDVESLASGDDGDLEDWEGGNLRFRTVDAASRAPLAGVRLSLYAPRVERSTGTELLGNPIGAPDAVTDERGLAELRAPPGQPLRLIAYGQAEGVGGCVLSVEALGPDERREVVVEVPVASGREFWGRLLDRTTKRPVEGATVTLFSGAPATTASRLTSAKQAAGGTRSDAHGLFVLHPAPWTAGFARVEAPGYGPVLTEVTDEHADPSMAEELELSGAGTLEAEVLDGNGGPLKGAVLTVSAASYDVTQPEGGVLLADDLRWTAEIGWDGRVRLADLAANAPLTVQIALAGRVLLRESGRLVLKPGETRRESWRLGGAMRLSGELLDQDGLTIPGQELWLTGDALPGRLAGEACFFEPVDSLHVVARCTTDESGRFALEQVPAGRWLVGPAPRLEESALDDDSVSPWAVVVEMSAGTSEQHVTLRAARALSIRGVVVDPNGDPLASREVRAWPDHPGAALAARSDADGLFALGPLEPGTWTLQASGGEGLAPSDRLQAVAGTAGLELRLHAPSTLKGQVVAGTGEDPPTARVSAWPAGDTTATEPAAMTWSGADDGFEIDHLGAGRYDLLAQTGDGRLAVVRGVAVADGETVDGLELVLGAAARLRIEYDGAQRYGRFAVLSAGSTVAVGAVHPGAAKVVVVPEGPLEVRFTTPARPTETRTVDAAAAAEAALRFSDA